MTQNQQQLEKLITQLADKIANCDDAALLEKLIESHSSLRARLGEQTANIDIPQQDPQPASQGAPPMPDVCAVIPTLASAAQKRNPNNQKRTLARVMASYFQFRAHDTQGAGQCAKSEAIDILASHMTERNARGILNDGDGITWRIMDDTIYLFAPDRVSITLDAGELTGRRVYVPYSEFCGGIQQVKATFLASFDAGRRRPSPMTRATRRKLTNVPERTQQDYDKVAPVTVIKNFGTNGDKFNKYNVEKHRLDGRHPFKWYDHLGKHFKKRTSVIVWREPNSYDADYLQAPLGRQQKQNDRIGRWLHRRRGSDSASLVTSGVADNGNPQGNGSEIVPMYHLKASDAERHASSNPDSDHYYQLGRALTLDASKPSKLGGVTIWRAMN